MILIKSINFNLLLVITSEIKLLEANLVGTVLVHKEPKHPVQKIILDIIQEKVLDIIPEVTPEVTPEVFQDIHLINLFLSLNHIHLQ